MIKKSFSVFLSGRLKFLAGVFSGLLLSLSLLCPEALARNVVIFGDAQHDEKVQGAIVALAMTYRPSAVFRVGDLVENGNDPGLWLAFKNINRPLLRSARYFPALGNHDKESPLYFKQFPRIRDNSWYSVNEEGIHFIVLDSNLDLRPGSPQYESLLLDLREAKDKYRFKVALFHHPLFNVGNHLEDEKKLRPILVPLFKEYGVCAVFSGHEHAYQHFEYDGIHFIGTGGGGSRLTSQKRENPYLKKFIKAYHLCVLTPGKDVLTLQVVDKDAQKIDEFTISPSVRSKRTTD